MKSLQTGETIAIDADRQMETMSTIKIPLMVEVFEQIKAGRFKLTDKYTFVEADSQPGTGTIQRLDYGAVMTVKDLITMMIIVSDNTATEVLYRMVGGPDAVNARMQALGLKTTRAMNVPSKWFPALRAAPTTEQFYRDGKSPFGLSTRARDGPLLEMMERGTLVDKPSSDLMLHIMRGQLYRTRIPRYVTGYTIPHKTGDFLPYVGDDVGILEAPGKTIVLSVFTGNHFGSGEALKTPSAWSRKMSRTTSRTDRESAIQAHLGTVWRHYLDERPLLRHHSHPRHDVLRRRSVSPRSGRRQLRRARQPSRRRWRARLPTTTRTTCRPPASRGCAS